MQKSVAAIAQARPGGGAPRDLHAVFQCMSRLRVACHDMEAGLGFYLREKKHLIQSSRFELQGLQLNVTKSIQDFD